LFTTIIIEDEKPAARRLSRMLNKKGILALTMLHSVFEAVEWLQNNPNPDLIFLDIQLSDGLSFEIFEQVQVKSAIIFTTAYDEYALKAFKLNSVDYLLKPIDTDELNQAIQKFSSQRKQIQNQVQDIARIKEMLTAQQTQFKTRFTVQVGQYLKMIETDNIVCFYSHDSATFVHVTNGKSYVFEKSLDQIEKDLDLSKFYRVNRSIIVHVEAITSIISYTNSRLKIQLSSFDEVEIIVSRERVKDFKNWLS